MFVATELSSRSIAIATVLASPGILLFVAALATTARSRYWRERRWLVLGPALAIECVILGVCLALAGSSTGLAVGGPLVGVGIQAAVSEISLRALPPAS